MLKFIRDKTAAPYFSNFVWFIGNHILEMDAFLLTEQEYDEAVRRAFVFPCNCAVRLFRGRVLDRISDLVAEHLDHIHYLNDILSLKIDPLNQVLTEQLLRRLFIPLYLGSLAVHLQVGLPSFSFHSVPDIFFSAGTGQCSCIRSGSSVSLDTGMLSFKIRHQVW